MKSSLGTQRRSVRVFVSASTRCFAKLDFWQALRQIHDLEFDKVEIWLDEQGSLKPSDVVSNPEDFIAELRDKTRLSPIAFSLAQEIDTPEFASLCKACKILRVTQIIVPASPLGTPFNTEIDRLKSLVSVAAAEGIRVAIKTEKGQLSGDAHTAVELCQSTKGLGLAFDPSYFIDSNPDKILDLVSPYVLHVHLRDSTPEQLQVQVGLGEIDYSKIVTQLERHHYNRALSVEILPELIEEDQRALELRKLRMLLDSLL